MPTPGFPRLEDNHTVTEEDGLFIVRCPYQPETSNWSLNAAAELDCHFCENLNAVAGKTDGTRWDLFPGEGTEEQPPISGGAHGGIHMWNEYAMCKVPLRRVSAFNIQLTVHEGRVDDFREAHSRWIKAGGPNFFLIRQADSGCYNCRNSVGHSRAIADDYNWRDNPYIKPRPAGGCPMQPGMKAFYETCWKPLDYGHGANWNSACDSMHISKVPNEGGDGRLYVVHANKPQPEPKPKSIDEEDDVAFAILSATQERITIPVYKPGKVHLAIDLGGPAKVRVAIGKAGTNAEGKSYWQIHDDVVVKVGERKTFDIPKGSAAQMVSLRHLEGGNVGIVVV